MPEIVFIDAGAPDIETLRAGLRPGIDAVLLGASRPALAQMADALRQRQDVAVVHVIAHGAPGRIGFAAGELSLATIEGHHDDLATIGQALSADGEIRLWACEAALGPCGAAFTASLAERTGARVRGSSGRVGAALRGGHWQLDSVADDRSAAGEALPPLTSQAIAEYRGVLVAAAPTLTVDDPLVDSNEVTAVPYTVGPGLLGGSVTFIDNFGTTVSVPTSSGSHTIDLSSMVGRYVTSQLNGVYGSGPSVTPFTSYGNTIIVATSANLVLQISEFNSIPSSEWVGNPAYTSVTVKDTAAAFAALTGSAIANMAANGVTNIASNSGTLALTVDQYLNLGGMDVNAPAKILDTAAHIGALTTTDLAGMAAQHIKILQYTDAPLTLSVAQYTNLGGVLLPGDHSTTLSDDGTVISLLSTTGLYAAGIGALVGTSAVALTAAQAVALGKVTVSAPSVTLSDTSANISGLTNKQLAALAGWGFTAVDSTDPTLNLTAAQFQSLGPVALDSGDTVTLKDTWTNISALDFPTLQSLNIDSIYVTNGSFSISTTQFNNLFGVSLAGPAVAILTGTTSDFAALDLATLFAAGISRIDSTDGQLTLDYDQYAELNGVQLTSADFVTLADDSSILRSLTAGQIGGMAAGRIDQLGVTSPDHALTWGLDQFNALGTVVLAANTVLSLSGDVAGPSNDTFSFSRQPFSAADKIDGGSGTDTLSLQGSYGTLHFASDTITGIEKLQLKGGGGLSYNITEDDGNVGTGQSLTVTASGFTATDTAVFNGSAETDGTFSFVGGAAGSSTFIGGSGADTFTGGSGGTTTMTGGGGADTINAGAGADTVRYTSAADSNSSAYDLVNGFNGAVDSFSWTHSVTWAGTVGGALRSSNFENDLTAAFTGLGAERAAVFKATSGNMAGQVFLLINDGATGFQAGSDVIVRLANNTDTSTFSNGTFKVG